MEHRRSKEPRFQYNDWAWDNWHAAKDQQETIRQNIRAIAKHQGRTILSMTDWFKLNGSQLSRLGLYRKRTDKRQTDYKMIVLVTWSRELFVPTWLLLHPNPFEFPDILEESIRLYKRAQIDRLRQSIEKGEGRKV
jgi:hypothetical protein